MRKGLGDWETWRLGECSKRNIEIRKYMKFKLLDSKA
jgi:hypothetical protein